MFFVFNRVCYFCSIFIHKVVVTATLLRYAFTYLPELLEVSPPSGCDFFCDMKSKTIHLLYGISYIL